MLSMSAGILTLTALMIHCSSVAVEEEDMDEGMECTENIERVLDCRPSRTNPAEIHIKFKGAPRMSYTIT